MLVLGCSGLAEVLDAAYAAFRKMIAGDGAVFGPDETPLGATRRDSKRYVEFGGELRDDLPPPVRALREALCCLVDGRMHEMDAIPSDRIGPELATLVDRDRGPVLRLSWYPGHSSGEVNQPHTDIDLFTLLPAATGPGLEVLVGGRWTPVNVSRSEVLVIPGELIQHFGGSPPAVHRVVASGIERVSASLFVNGESSQRLDDGRELREVVRTRLAVVRGNEEDGLG